MHSQVSDKYGSKRNSPDTSSGSAVYRCPHCKGIGDTNHGLLEDRFYCAGTAEVNRERFWSRPDLKLTSESVNI